MPRTNPWHSILAARYHNNTACTEGNNIEAQYFRWGTGNKPLCDHCYRLNQAGR